MRNSERGMQTQLDAIMVNITHRLGDFCVFCQNIAIKIRILGRVIINMKNISHFSMLLIFKICFTGCVSTPEALFLFE